MGDHGGIGFGGGISAEGVNVRQWEASPTLAQQRPRLSPRPAMDWRRLNALQPEGKNLRNFFLTIHEITHGD